MHAVARRSKIVCTLGPASDAPRVLAGMVAAGMDVARLNFSHGTHAEHLQAIERIRSVETRIGKPIAILQDEDRQRSSSAGWIQAGLPEGHERPGIG